MLRLAFFFILISSVKGAWFPVMFPVHHRHHHTTHVVTHPVVHTRVIYLGDDEHHHHGHNRDNGHRQGYSHEDNSPHHAKYANHYETGRHAIYGKSSAPDLNSNPPYLKNKARYNDDSDDPEKYHGGHTYNDNFNSQREIQYSILESESPWKPLSHLPNHVPKGFLPLKYLGIDERTVAKIVRQAMSEIEEDLEEESKPRFPTGIQDVIRAAKKQAKKMYTGAVFYDDVPQGRHGHSSNHYVPDYQIKTDPLRKNTFKWNVGCEC